MTSEDPIVVPSDDSGSEADLELTRSSFDSPVKVVSSPQYR